MKYDHSAYHSYLLRLWRVQEKGEVHWRASLENVLTGEMHGFADLAALQAYLDELDSTNQEFETVILHHRPE